LTTFSGFEVSFSSAIFARDLLLFCRKKDSGYALEVAISRNSIVKCPLGAAIGISGRATERQNKPESRQPKSDFDSHPHTPQMFAGKCRILRQRINQSVAHLNRQF
jgi:hypothetical protein